MALVMAYKPLLTSNPNAQRKRNSRILHVTKIREFLFFERLKPMSNLVRNLK